jgi:hypothetical protein
MAIDSFGRKIDVGMAPEAFVKFLTDGITAGIEKLIPTDENVEEKNKNLKTIEKNISKLVDKYDETAREMKEFAQAVIAAKGGKGGKGGGGKVGDPIKMAGWGEMLKNEKQSLKTDTMLFNMEKKLFPSTKAFNEAGLRNHSIATKDLKVKDLMQQLLEINQEMLYAQRRGAGGKGAGATPGAMMFPGRGMGVVDQMMRRLQSGVGGILGGITLYRVFDDTLKAEYEYLKGMREIAYQTQGITGDMQDLQSRWSKLGDTVKYTGVRRAKFQKIFMQNVRKGIKDLKISQKVTQTGLHLSRQIGDETLAIGTMFHDWHMTLGLSSAELHSITMGTREVAKATGVTGENLVKALQGSEKLLTQLRNAGNLTDQAAKNVIGTMAAAQKYGVGDQISRLNSALTSQHELLWKASQETRNFWFEAASFAEGIKPGISMALQEGKGLEPGHLRALLEGAAENFRQKMRDVGISIGPDIRDVLEHDIESMAPDIRAALDTQFKFLYGMGVAEFQRALKAQREASLPFWEKMKELNEDFDKIVSASTQETMQHEQRKQDMILAEAATFTAAWDKALAGSKTIEEALKSEDLNRALTEGAKSLEAMGVEGSPAEVMEQIAQKQFQILGSRAKELGKGLDYTFDDWKKARLKGGAAARDANQALIDENQRIAKLQEDATDPVKKTVRILDSINEKIGQLSADIQTVLYNLLGAGGIIAITLGIIAHQVGLLNFGKVGGMLGAQD